MVAILVGTVHWLPYVIRYSVGGGDGTLVPEQPGNSIPPPSDVLAGHGLPLPRLEFGRGFGSLIVPDGTLAGG
jgi:hypothetical protein